MIVVIYHYPYHSMISAGSEARGVCGVNEYWEENRNTCEWTCNKECRFRVSIFYI